MPYALPIQCPSVSLPPLCDRQQARPSNIHHPSDTTHISFSTPSLQSTTSQAFKHLQNACMFLAMERNLQRSSRVHCPRPLLSTDVSSNGLEVACTGEGAWFIEASANCSLADIDYFEQQPLVFPKRQFLPCLRLKHSTRVQSS